MEEYRAGYRILVADDDINVHQSLNTYFRREGYQMISAYDGQEAIDHVRKSRPDIVLLDIMMPKMDGLEVCRRIRDTCRCPILFVTAKGRTLDTLVGLEMGADDYITKPFVVDELVARVKAHLRREERSHATDGDVYVIGELTLCRSSYEVIMRGERAQLSTREFELLCFLCENAGRVLSKEEIFSGVWGGEYGDVGTVAVHIKNLRDKLHLGNDYIKTVWGVGYKLVAPHEVRV